jgi:hypothetical protein
VPVVRVCPVKKPEEQTRHVRAHRGVAHIVSGSPYILGPYAGINCSCWARGHAVVQALGYKPQGRLLHSPVR